MVAASKRKNERSCAKFNRPRQTGNNQWWMEHERRGSHSLSFPCGSIHLGFQVKKEKKNRNFGLYLKNRSNLANDTCKEEYSFLFVIFNI